MINKTLIAFKSKEENVAKFAKADQQLREFVCCYFEIYDEKKQTLQNKLSSFFFKTNTTYNDKPNNPQATPSHE